MADVLSQNFLSLFAQVGQRAKNREAHAPVGAGLDKSLAAY
jgi:hypothetical protein